MAIRTYKPTSPARRFMSVLTYEETVSYTYLTLPTSFTV